MNLELAFEGFPVRMVGTPEDPEWVAKDVCEVFGIKNSSDAIAEFDEVIVCPRCEGAGRCGSFAIVLEEHTGG